MPGPGVKPPEFEDLALGRETVAVFEAGHCIRRVEALSAEAPLTIRIAGRPFVTILRTPGADRELVVGFLRAEGLLVTRQDLISLRECDALDDPEHEGHVYQVQLSEEAQLRLAKVRRAAVSASSCGLCGRERIETALEGYGAPALEVGVLDPEWILSLAAKLRAGQLLFARSGSMHAAALAQPGGELALLFEDVGRHNAVDKILGFCWLQAQAAQGRVLVVSGRVSFEIVQKAAALGVFAIVAVSAPTTLAVQMARCAQMTLIGFIRDRKFVVYSHPERVLGFEGHEPA